MNWWQRLGGPSGITFLGWILLSPISILFTAEFVPEGYLEGWSSFDGYLIGTISHLATGLVLLLGKLGIARLPELAPRPLITVLVMGLAGLTRGFATSFGLEYFGITATADYQDRMAAGAVLIIIWFSSIAIVLDSRTRHRLGFQELSEQLQRQRLLAERGRALLAEREQSLIEQVRMTLNDALRVGSKTEDIHDAVDQLVRPLAHQLSESRPELTESTKMPRVRIRFWPISRAAFRSTPFNYVPVIFVSVLGTLYSKLWQLGLLGVLDSVLSAMFIWFFFSLGAKLRLFGWWAWLPWIAAGLASGLTTGILGGENPLANPLSVFFVPLALNVIMPALMVAFLSAYEFESRENLKSLRGIVDAVQWETVALQQQAWVQQKRIARFVHSDLQARIRSFALRLDLAARQPSESDIDRLRTECQASLTVGGEYQDFEKFILELRDLWDGVVDIELSADAQSRDWLAGDSFAQIAMVEIVREAVTNAVRHGRATSVAIGFAAVDSGVGPSLELTVGDNGTSPAEGNSGLGSQIIGELTLSWNLEKNEHGALLRARLPIRRPELIAAM